VDNPALEEFVEEVEEIIEDLEEGVLELEVQPKKRSLIDRIFRDMHTISRYAHHKRWSRHGHGDRIS